MQTGRIPAWKLCALSPPFTVPSTRGQHLWAEVWDERCPVLDPCPWMQVLHVLRTHQEVPPGGQKRELLSPIRRRQGYSPR